MELQERFYENISLTNTHSGQSPFYYILYIRMILTYGKFNNKCAFFFIELYRVRHLTLPSEISSINIAEKAIYRMFHKRVCLQILMYRGKPIVNNFVTKYPLIWILYVMIRYMDSWEKRICLIHTRANMMKNVLHNMIKTITGMPFHISMCSVYYHWCITRIISMKKKKHFAQ